MGRCIPFSPTAINVDNLNVIYGAFFLIAYI